MLNVEQFKLFVVGPQNVIIWRDFFFCGGGFNTHSSFPNFPPDNLLNFFREEPFFFFMLGLKTDLGAF